MPEIRISPEEEKPKKQERVRMNVEIVYRATVEHMFDVDTDMRVKADIMEEEICKFADEHNIDRCCVKILNE